MYDLAYFRNNLEAIASRLADRGFTLDINEFRKLDTERRLALTEAEGLKALKNTQSQEVGKLKKAGQDTAELQQQIREMGDRAAELEQRAAAADESFRQLMAGIPNTPHESVPAGRSADDNVEVKKWGTPRTFDFEPKAHWDLGPELGILDFDRAAKITGARFAVYMGLGAKLERALINFMLDVHTKEHGYTEVLPPFLINSASLYGTGQLPKFAQDLFKLENTDYWLAPTAEVPVTNLFRDETLEAERLPVKYCAYTPCFRSEAGSYGRDVRGIIRQHQFQKVELVKFAHPDNSHAELDKVYPEDRLSEAYIEIYNPHLNETWYTDPTYYWYRQCFLDVVKQSGWTAYNCTEGGTLIGEGIEWMALDHFIKEQQGRDQPSA